MGLAEARGAVNEEGVVGLPGRFRDGVRRGSGQLVRLTDDERLERVALVERRGRGGRLLSARGGFARRDEEVHLRAPLAIFLDAEHHGGRPAEYALCRAREHARVLRLVPLHGELIRRADDKPPVVQCDRLRRLEPGAHGRVGKFTARLVEEALPSFFCGLLHRR